MLYGIDRVDNKPFIGVVNVIDERAIRIDYCLRSISRKNNTNSSCTWYKDEYVRRKLSSGEWRFKNRLINIIDYISTVG